MQDALHENDPIEALLARASDNSATAESQTLVKALLSVIRNQDDVSVGELCALSAGTLDLLHAFAQACMAGRYDRNDLERVAATLVSRHSAALHAVRIAA